MLAIINLIRKTRVDIMYVIELAQGEVAIVNCA
jgi:hypothetical protein